MSPQASGDFPAELEPHRAKAARIVDKAIKGKGDVQSGTSTIGSRIQSFTDVVSPQIWEKYVARATTLVDEGHPAEEIDSIARQEQVQQVASMLLNQAQTEES